MRHIQRSIEPESTFSQDQVLFMIGEELKKPLTAIKALAESAQDRAIQLESKKALRSIDNILYYQQLANKQLELSFTTVHIGNTLAEVAHEMQPLSIERGCETEIRIQSGVSPVHADPTALRLGIESLWQAVIGMTNKPSTVNWHMYKNSRGVRLVVVNNSLNLEKVRFTKPTINLSGNSRQPITGIAGPATDLITANGIFSMLGVQLSKVVKEGQHGLAITLPISKQLALV